MGCDETNSSMKNRPSRAVLKRLQHVQIVSQPLHFDVLLDIFCVVSLEDISLDDSSILDHKVGHLHG